MEPYRNKFYVLALPRSRTFWLSRFLTTDTCKVGHDDCCNYATIDDLNAGDFDGMCDTALILKWRELKGRIVLIERDYGEVIESLAGIGIAENYMLPKLADAIEDAADVHPAIRFEDLKYESVCKWLFEYLTSEPFDRERWSQMDKQIIEVDVASELTRFAAHKENLKSMFG